MKTPSDELFNLVKSLSSEEKRQFKLFSQHNSEHSIYLQLFDSIDALEQYDEKKLLAVMNKKDGIKHVKKYLREALFSFLEYYYSDFSVAIQLQRTLQRTEILCAKRQFLTAKKSLEKAEQLALENHQYLYLLQIFWWKKRIMGQTEQVMGQEEYDRQYANEKRCLEMYNNILEYDRINMQLRDIFITQSTNPDASAKAELNKLLTNPFLKDEKRALSARAKAYYYFILGDIHLMLHNWEKAYDCFRQLVYDFEPARLDASRKINAYARMLVILHELRRYDELLLVKHDVVQFYKSIPGKSKQANLYSLYLSVMVNYIDYKLSVFNIREALSTSDEIQEDIEKYATTQTFLVFYTNKFFAFFFMADYRKALHCANKIVASEKEIRQDITSDFKVLLLLLHYELDNENLLPNLCRSAMHYYNKQEQPHFVEKTIICFFDKIICKVKTKKEKVTAFSNLKKELELHQSEEILKRFDFISWAESKIQNRPMVEILKEKSLKV